MPRLADLPDPPEVRAALAAEAGRLKHDLGKYVAMQQRWLGAEPTSADLRQAVRSDVLETRRGPQGTVDAVAVWAEFRAVLHGEADLSPGVRINLADDPDVAALDAAMGTLERQMPDLASGAASDQAILETHAAAIAVSNACRDLARRLGQWARRTDG